MIPNTEETVFIPRSKNELMNAFNSTLKSEVDCNSTILRIFTDYKRANKSHFWSESSKNWWNIENEDDHSWTLVRKYDMSHII